MSSRHTDSPPPMLTPDSTGTPESLLLTPDTTGTPESVPAMRRKHSAFYPHLNSTNKTEKPFSRSAAKRQSVMALGSIEHLQHYFTKTGIAAKQSAIPKGKGLVPAIGGPMHVRTNPSISSLKSIDLPPSPLIPQRMELAFPPHVKNVETDPDTLLPGVVEDLNAVVHAWGIGTELSSKHDSQMDRFDVLSTLITTTRAVRSIRNYVVSLPDDDLPSNKRQFRPSSLSSLPPSKNRPRSSSKSANSDTLARIRRSALDVLDTLRQLEVSSRLPLEDDAYDAQSDHGQSDGPSQTSSSISTGGGNVNVGASIPRIASPSSVSDDGSNLQAVHEMDVGLSAPAAFSLVRVQGRQDSVPVWEEEDDINLNEVEQEPREYWDEKLVLSSGWLYKQDIQLKDLEKERAAVSRYLDTVDSTLFDGSLNGKRGWERELESRSKARNDALAALTGASPRLTATRRVVSASAVDLMRNASLAEEPEAIAEEQEEEILENAIDDEDLPLWAKRTSFPDDPLGRAHALLVHLLPANLLPFLAPPSPSSSLAFLEGLSSGQLLCVAYNAGVRRSRKPWGYVSKDAIHDIIALEENNKLTQDKEGQDRAKKSWTFRRTDNFRIWAAALKLRYLIPVITPPQEVEGIRASPASSPSASKFASLDEPPMYFDARIIARKEDGWTKMLIEILERWVTHVVEERRGER